MSHPCKGCPEAVTDHPRLHDPYELWCKMFDEPKRMSDMCNHDHDHDHHHGHHHHHGHGHGHHGCNH